MRSRLAVVNLKKARWDFRSVLANDKPYYLVGCANLRAVPSARTLRFHCTLASVLAHQLFGFLDAHRYSARLGEPLPVGNVYVLLVFPGSFDVLTLRSCSDGKLLLVHRSSLVIDPRLFVGVKPAPCFLPPL